MVYKIDMEEIRRRRRKAAETKRRRVLMGYDPYSYIRADGSMITQTPKKIQNWYSTRELVKRVEAAFERNGVRDGKQVCYINGAWRLQIRGKHLRRLLKAMPGVRQEGRSLVRDI